MSGVQRAVRARGGRPAGIRPRALAGAIAATVIALAVAVAAFVLGGGRPRGDVAIDTWTFVAPGLSPRAVTLPAHFDRELPKEPVVFHLRARVALPDDMRGRAVTLVVPHLWGPVTLEADGASVEALDRWSLIAERPQAAHAFTLAPSQTSRDEVDLDLSVTYTWTQAAWVDVVPYVTIKEAGGLRYTVLRVFQGVASAAGAVAVGTLGFVYAIIFAFDRRRRAEGWFAAQGLSALLYPLHIWGPSQLLFGPYDTAVLTVLLSAALVFSHEFTSAHFGLPRPSRIWTFGLAATALAAIVGRSPYESTHGAAVCTVVIVTTSVVRQIWLVGGVVVRRGAPADATVIFACWIMLFATSWYDLVAWAGYGEFAGGLHGGSVGITTFAVLQSVLLSRDYATALVDASRLSATLAEQVDRLARGQEELDRLNTELRRQVLARAEALSEALARLASAQGAATVLREGDVVDDRYVVVRGIGAGGMGVVYEVRRTDEERRLALKVLSGAPSVEAMARFAREAKLVATVSHPNVVGVVDAGVSPSGFLYLVMEYVEGAPLGRYRDRFGNVPWALAVLRGVARGLAAVHAQGIVHRDLKPGNVLVRETAEGVHAKLTDFGISNTELEASGGTGPRHNGGGGASEITSAAGPRARRACSVPEARDEEGAPRGGGQEPTLTRTGHVLGTPGYMAPELLRDARKAQTSADVYGLGVLAYELLFRERPFDEIQALARAHGLAVATLRSFAPVLQDVAPRLSALLDGTLAVTPEERPTAAEIAEELDKVPLPVSMRPRPPSSAAPSSD